MSDALNTIDALLQATSPRLLAPVNGAIILDTTTPIFHITTGGSDPLSIAFSARLIALEGIVTFSSVGGTLTSISGNTCVLLESDMPGDTATVTAELTYRGTLFTTTVNISKVTDGAGTAGDRGAGTYYATGSSWSDTTANTATPGSNVLDDVVNISNGSTFVNSKRWNGSAWVAIGTVIDGSLLVTGSVTAAKITANGLSVRKSDGTIILDASGDGVFIGELDSVTGTFDTITAGHLQNAGNTNYIELNATGTNTFIKVGSAIDIKADGTGLFAREIVSDPDVIASGTKSVSSGTLNPTNTWTDYIDTGVDIPTGWATASTEMYAASATIAGGTSTFGGMTGYSNVTVVHGDGLYTIAGAITDNRLYIKFVWQAPSSGGTITITSIDWKLVRI